MAIVTYPLNNINYSAEDAELFHCTRTSGVFAADEDFNASVTGTNNTVTIGQGIAWIRNSRFSGKVVANKSSFSVNMGLANGTYNRIDAIVLQFSASSNLTAFVVKQGTAATSPTAPPVTQTESLYELHLYHVYRRAGATSILASDIIDLRADRRYCGVMADDVTMLGDDFVNKDMIGVANGVASLNSSGKVPTAQLPAMNFIPTSQKGTANGVATLGTDGKIPSSQIPELDYFPNSELDDNYLNATLMGGDVVADIYSSNIKINRIGNFSVMRVWIHATLVSEASNLLFDLGVSFGNSLANGDGGVLCCRNLETGEMSSHPAYLYDRYLEIRNNNDDISRGATFVMTGLVVLPYV